MLDESSTILQFSFFIIFALMGTVLSIRLRQPYVVGLLIFGMLAGPNVFGIINDRGLISTFSDLGAVLLLFAVGIEFSISRIIRSGLRAVAITTFKMGALFFISYEAALFFGLDLTAALVVGAMFSITSTTILFKMVAEKGMAKNPVLSLLFSMLILEDIAAVAALTFFSTLGSGPVTYEDKLFSVLLSLGLLGVFYLVVRKPAARAILRLTTSLTQEVVIFVSFSLCLVISMVAAFFGLTPAIGAFLAGSIISGLPNSRSIEKSIRPLLLMFASLFFLSLGMQIEPALVISNLGFSVAITILFVAVCFISILSMLYLTGARVDKAVFGASAMVVLGEFSLLIASVYTGEYSRLLLAAGSFGVVATAIASSFLLDRQKQLLELEARAVPPGLRTASRSLSAYITGLIRDFSPSGSFWRISRLCWSCISWKLARIAAIALAVFFARLATRLMDIEPSSAAQLRSAILIAGALPILYYLYRILLDLRPALDALSRTIARHKRNAKPENLILRDLAVAVALALLAFNVHELVSFLQLPPFFLLVDDLLFLVILVFAWDILRHAGELHRSRRK